jgi:CrcB protein
VTWLAIGVGGALGSMARHAVHHLLRGQLRFPLATCAVNLLGCFLIGLLSGWLSTGRVTLSLPWREFAVIGLLGGFTTFSTFGFETFVLGRSGSSGLVALNIAVQVAGGLAAVWAGHQLGGVRP